MPTLNELEILAGGGLTASSLNPSIMERMMREGDPYALFSNFTSTGVAIGDVNVGSANALQLPKAAKAVWLNAMTISASHLCVIQPSIGSDVNGRFTSLTNQIVVAPGVPVTIPVNIVFRGFQMQTGAISVNIRKNLSGAVADITTAIGATGILLTDDFDYGAKNVILWAGDSTANGSSYNSTAASRMAKVRDYFRAKGPSARLLLKSRSGSTTNDHEAWRLNGWYDIGQADMCFYDVGINSAANGYPVGDANTPNTYVSDVNLFWQWWKVRYPGKRMIVLGCSPLENDTKEAAAVQYRAAAASFVQSINSPLLSYINTGDAFDRKGATTFYAASDPAGDRVHRNDNGELAMFARIKTGLDSLGITLP